jgi:hypothetical protein
MTPEVEELTRRFVDELVELVAARVLTEAEAALAAPASTRRREQRRRPVTSAAARSPAPPPGPRGTRQPEAPAVVSRPKIAALPRVVVRTPPPSPAADDPEPSGDDGYDPELEAWA